MKADYSKIAPQYDRTRARKPARVDPVLTRMLTGTNAPSECRALDLGCGTGNYLKAQIERGPASVIWQGLDASADMLEIARGKLPAEVILTQGVAQHLPFEDCAFDFVALQAVFHHFPNKEVALDEIDRTVSSDGVIHIRNGVFEHRKDFWIYRYFPETRRIDEKRFWSVNRIFDALDKRGYQPHAKINHQKLYQAKSEVLLWAENRDMSQLSLLDDAAFDAGLKRLNAEVSDWVLTEWATLDLSAQKR